LQKGVLLNHLEINIDNLGEYSMRSINKYLATIEEGKGWGMTGAILSGLGGAITGGHIVGSYQSRKAESAQRETDRRKGI
jgi:hypothetical protein